MRIGLLTTCYPRHPHDLAGRFVADLAGWLARAGDHLEVLAPHPAAADPDSRVTVRPLRYAPGRPRLLYGAGAPDNLRNDPLAVAQVPLFVARLAAETRLRRGRWDCVMSHWLAPCGLVAATACAALPHLAVAHSTDVTMLSRLAGGSHLLHLLARPRSALVLTSEYLRPKLLELARSHRARQLVQRAPVIRMGTQSAVLGARSDHERELHTSSSGFRVLFLGRLVPVKGVDLLLQACAGLEGVTLWIAGDGPERPGLERLALQLGLAGPKAARRVRFWGEQLGPDKQALLRRADLLVLPSRVLPDGRTDSAPVVLLEAMAAGLPVVASDVGGNAELLQHRQNGLLIPSGQILPLRRAIRALRDDPRLLAGIAEAGRQTASRFTWDQLGPRFRRLLVDLRRQG